MFTSTASALSKGYRFDEGNQESKFCERGLFEVCRMLGGDPGKWFVNLRQRTLDQILKSKELRIWIRSNEMTSGGLCGFNIKVNEKVPYGKIIITDAADNEFFLIHDATK